AMFLSRLPLEQLLEAAGRFLTQHAGSKEAEDIGLRVTAASVGSGRIQAAYPDRWRVLGPFELIGGSVTAHRYAPESSPVRLSARFQAGAGREVGWVPLAAGDDHVLDVHR